MQHVGHCVLYPLCKCVTAKTAVWVLVQIYFHIYINKLIFFISVQMLQPVIYSNWKLKLNIYFSQVYAHIKCEQNKITHCRNCNGKKTQEYQMLQWKWNSDKKPVSGFEAPACLFRLTLTEQLSLEHGELGISAIPVVFWMLITC